MTKPELLAFIRVLVDDTVADYSASDDTINKYIDEAEREGAERSLYLKTDSSFDINVRSGVASYDLDESIIFVERLKIQGATKPLIKTTKRELDFQKTNWELDVATDPAYPVYYFQERNRITLYPIPSADYKLQVDASRRPLYSMETPEELHESLAYWPVYRILIAPELDIYNPKAAFDNKKLFESVFGMKRTAWFDDLNRNLSMTSSMEPNPFN
jgi:hypothetical protein